MAYFHWHPLDDPLIEPVPPAVLVDPRVTAPRMRHSNHVPEFGYLVGIESFQPQDEFGDSEGDLILEKVRGYKNACRGLSDNGPYYSNDGD
jgi:hypothetical protein